ncbi:hypothetical protein ONS95_007274 [Cadophora gregata]|uniref:uncharacterized protein n=1 Tax=Cadophora gregata TaxID=51156 RepID=UPI0026DD74E2|nr:uncharacterized protein ONS95_007274 [Cadophora gregata]KAK0100826.1 hypothetical protein ONS95_007274 [Cadophora gregata]KAK0117180.1 hypothetical protein ONS96_013013 [Cadophora gregata f. sp. sojae]
MLFRIATLSIFSLLWVKSSATRNVSCSLIQEKFANGYNASGSISFPGFRVNDSYPESNWTFSRYIAADYSEPRNESEVWQTIGMKTSPTVNLTDPKELPYTGCYMVLMTSEKKNFGDGQKEDGSCNSVLSADCIKDLITHVNDTAASYSGTSGGTNSTKLNCFDLMSGLVKNEKSKCWQQYPAWFDDQFLPEYPGISSTTNATDNPIVSCPPVGAGDMDTFHLGYNQAAGPNRFTDYDRVLKTPLAVVLTAWLKDDHSPYMDVRRWADTRLMCIPGNIASPGSRNLTEALKSGGMTTTQGWSGWMMSIILVGFALSTFL